MSHRLYTIGYEGLDLAAFLGVLGAHGIECVLDVRENPFSRKPGFSGKSLSQALEAAGIRYLHIRQLGTPRPLRERVRSDEDYERFFAEMRQYLTTQQDAVDQAYNYVRRMTCCLVCYELSVNACHRKVVAEAIRDRSGDGLDVVHLRTE